MICLCRKCATPTVVLTTYQNKDNSTRRRRECPSCGLRFTTRETAVETEQEVAKRVKDGDLKGEKAWKK